MSVLDPLSHALAAVLAGAHTALTSLGADADAGLTWVLAIAAVVVVVKTALLPLVVRGVRQTHAAARARPHLLALAERHRTPRGRGPGTAPSPDDLARLRALAAERREIAAEHGMSRLGCLPVLLQLPVLLALYHLLADVTAGAPVGAVDVALVASLGAATLAGVPLAAHGHLGGGFAHLAVVVVLAGTAAALSYLTQRFVVAPNTLVTDLPEAMARAHSWLPALSAGGLLVAGGVVPVALLVYWVCSNVWTLGQCAVVTRCFPTPGTPAAAARAARVG